MSAYPRGSTRNAGTAIIFRRCDDCRRGRTFLVPLDDEGRVAGEPKPVGPHCRSCHSDEHNACSRCGRCLPRSGRGAFAETWRGGPAVRQDRRYCSNACRQAAYRERRDAR